LPLTAVLILNHVTCRSVEIFRRRKICEVK
jgi:hypothetical protein